MKSSYISESMFDHSKSRKNILIFVHAPHGTLGDPSAANKLANLWQKRLSEIYKQEVCVSIAVLQLENKYLERVKGVMGNNENVRYFLEDESTREDFSDYLNNFQANNNSIEFACLYPTPHFIQGFYRDVIEKWCYNNKIPNLSIPEYNHDVKLNKNLFSNSMPWPLNGAIIFNVGIGNNYSGVFSLSASPSEIHPNDYHAIEFLVKDIPGNSINDKWETYRAEQGYYFCYYNKIVFSASLATPKNFVELISKIHTAKDIDILMPLSLAASPTERNDCYPFTSFIETNFVEHLYFSKLLFSFADLKNKTIRHYLFEKNSENLECHRGIRGRSK